MPVEHCAGLVGGLGEQLIIINDLGSVEPRSVCCGMFTDGKAWEERSLNVLRAEMEDENWAQRTRTRIQRKPCKACDAKLQPVCGIVLIVHCPSQTSGTCKGTWLSQHKQSAPGPHSGPPSHHVTATQLLRNAGCPPLIWVALRHST